MDAAGYTRMEELQLAAYQNTYNDSIQRCPEAIKTGETRRDSNWSE